MAIAIATDALTVAGHLCWDMPNPPVLDQITEWADVLVKWEFASTEDAHRAVIRFYTAPQRRTYGAYGEQVTIPMTPFDLIASYEAIRAEEAAK
ncbi:hypothetical protein K8O93_00690 [Gordonia bronchialis]|uniref:hypothetical protein n=1 Tax=Gordonia bronchialis TaxID=2054 RepID=UPI001CC17D83|nr:hypothetical protein [Gordonia bronchialis]UAK38350.1 hypothetical protein K8O93_00690 [Gordonia bronchialis]